MRVSFAGSVVCLMFAACTTAPPAEPPAVEYVGSLEPVLGSTRGPGGVLEKASEAAIATLGDLAQEGAEVRVAEIDWKKDTKFSVFVIEPEDGEPYVVADGDGSGSYEPSEKSMLVTDKDGSTLREATVTLALVDGPLPSYDMVVGMRDYSGLDIDPEDMPQARLTASRPVVEGVVDVNGHQVKVKVPYSFETNGVAAGAHSVDANYDGEYDTWFTSREQAYVADGDPSACIYRIDDRYVSDQGYRPRQLADHPRRPLSCEDYKRIELEIGNELPDFDFVDFEGNAAQLVRVPRQVRAGRCVGYMVRRPAAATSRTTRIPTPRTRTGGSRSSASTTSAPSPANTRRA